MDLFSRLRVWERFGRVMNSRFGERFIGAFRGAVELLMKSIAAGGDDEAPPFTALAKDPSLARVALVTTAGIYVEGQEPFDTAAALGDSSWRAVPSDVDVSRLRIAHTHYPHERAEQDIDVVFPVRRLRELAEEGAIASVASAHYSFGFDLHVKELIDPGSGTAHAVARALRDDGVDAVLFTPG